MRAERIGGTGRLGRGLPAVAALGLVSALAVAGGGPAAAAPRGGAGGLADAQPAGVITTVAGGVGGPAKATKVSLPAPCGVSYADGRLYIADTFSVRKVNPGNDYLTTPAGTGLGGQVPEPPGNTGPAAKASVITCGTALDGAGNLVIADSGENRVRVVAAATGTFYGRHMTGGHIYSVAGTGASGFSGDGGLATAAELDAPGDVAVDAAGNLVIADSQNSRIRVVAAATGTFYGQHMTARHIYTVAGNGNRGYGGDGGPATSATLNVPGNVAVDAAGNLVISDYLNNRVRVVAASTGTFYGRAMTAGDIYTVAGKSKPGFSGDGGPATAAELHFQQAVTVDQAGNLVIADTGNKRIRVVAATTGTFYGQAMTAGDIYTVAGNGNRGYHGDGGPATSARLNRPTGVAVDGAGNLVIADSRNFRVRVVAATTGTFYGQAMTAGDIYTVAGNGNAHLSGGGGLATRAQFDLPEAVAVNAAGSLLISDRLNNEVRMVAASTGTFYGRAMTAGHIYAVAGDGTYGFSGDGGPATKAKLALNGIDTEPTGLAVDSAGNLLISDPGNARIRVVAASTGSFYGQAMTAGHIYTIAGNGTQGFSGDGGPATAAELDYPGGVAADQSGNLLITATGSETGNCRVRVVAAHTGTFYGQSMTAGDIYTIAGNGTCGFSGDGGLATGAEVFTPVGVTVDGAGNAVIADSDNNRVRVVAASTGSFYGQTMTAGHIYTVAGNGTAGFSGDGGPATAAEMTFPSGVAVDQAGNLIIADFVSGRVRVVAASTGSFYGQAMTAGHIYTVAGNGTQQFSGDGGPGTEAGLFAPTGVAVDPAGNLLIADSSNQRIRMVAG